MVATRLSKMVGMLWAIKVARLVKLVVLYLCLIIKTLCWKCSFRNMGNIMILFERQTLFNEICTMLKESGINLDGLFLNADPGFDADTFREPC
jgi:hypothetical protein